MSDKEIHQYLNDGRLAVVGSNLEFPFIKHQQVQPSSIDIRLGCTFRRFKKTVKSIDIKDLNDIDEHMETENYLPGEKIRLKPHEIIYGQAYEQIRIPDDASAQLEGKSRLSRLGISIHATGGFGNPGYTGAWPLQIKNHNHIEIILYPYMFIGQIILVKLTSLPLISYADRSNTVYKDETDIIDTSRSHMDEAVTTHTPNLIKSEIEKNTIDNYVEECKYNKFLNKKKNRKRKKTNKITIKNSQLGLLNTGEIEDSKK